MPDSTTLKGPVTLKISEKDECRQFLVPDPEDLPRGLPLSPAKKHILRFIRQTAMQFPSSPNSATAGTSTTQDMLADKVRNTESVIQNSGMSVDEGHSYHLPSHLNASAVSKFLKKVSTAVEIGPVGQKRMYRYQERHQITKQSPTNLRKKRIGRALMTGNPFVKGEWKCCVRFQCFKNIGPDRCYQEYKEVNSMNPRQAKRHLISLYNRSEKSFRIAGQVVCARFLSRALGFSNDMQCSIKNTPKARGSVIAKSRPREVKRKTKRAFIASFIRHLAKLFGDAMPHKEQITLPVLNRKALRLECKEAWEGSAGNKGDMVLSKNYFYRVWRAYADFVTVRKNHGFTECSRCEMLRAEMAKHLRDEETLITLIDQHAAHKRFIEKERSAYEERQALAEQNPRRYCSIIVDGADQKNYGLPHFAKNTKSDAGHKLKVKVVGVLEHVLRGQKWLSLYTMTEEYETGANHIIEVVHQSLQRKKTKNGVLPPALFVQVDNCIRENKNRYFMAYFQCLVHLGVFKMIQISFLPNGHTHADIDQTFSSISKHLLVNYAITLPDMIVKLRKCYGQRVTASELQGIINYSGLCENSGCLNDVDTFSEYRYFRFVQKNMGITAGLHSSECDVKVRDSDEWIPFPTSKAEGFIKFVPCFGQTPATSTKTLLNRSEVTKCLNSGEERVKNDSKINMLRQMQEKVRQEAFHGNLEDSFELNGYYADGANSGSDGTEINFDNHVDDVLRPNYGYDPDDFVAVVADGDVDTRFWIARVKEVTEIDEQGRAKKLTVRWYVATGKDPWGAKSNPAWKAIDGEQTVYEDDIGVESVLVRFECLTAAKKLRVRDKKAIKQTLNEN